MERKAVVVIGSSTAAKAALGYLQRYQFNPLMLNFEAPLEMAVQSLYGLSHSVQFYLNEDRKTRDDRYSLFFGQSYNEVAAQLLEVVANDPEFLGKIAWRRIGQEKQHEAFVFDGCADYRYMQPVIRLVGVKNFSLIVIGASDAAAQLSIPDLMTKTLPDLPDQSLMRALVQGTLKTHFGIEEEE